MKLNSALTQVCVIGMLAFCGPGMFNALNGLGAAGSGDPKVAAVTNGCLYATFAIVGYFAGSIFNVLGPRLSFSLGGLSYAIYALFVYFGTVSIVLPAVGGFQLGIGAGIFWCAQMALCIAYATEDNNSKLMSIFWVIFNLGGVFGGFLQCGLNWSLFSEAKGGVYTPEGNKASAAGYFTFVGIMCCSPILAMTLLASPKTVIRADGTSPKVKEAEPFIKELKDAAKGITDPFVLKMLVYFLFSNWFYTYEFGYLNGHFFNARFAGLNSGLYWAAQMLGATIVPFFTDNKSWSPKKRAWGGLYLCTFFLVVSWIIAIIIQHTSCNGLVDKDSGNLDATYPSGKINKTVAWFPDVCEQYPQIDALWGQGTCSNGCEFLRYCRITPRSSNPSDYYTATGTNMICDIAFPRCANDGSERKAPKMLDGVCEASSTVLDKSLCFNSYNFGNDLSKLSFTGAKEAARCSLDLVGGETSVCSTVKYATLNGDIVRTNAFSAEKMCAGIDAIPTAKVSPVMEVQWDDELVVDVGSYTDSSAAWTGLDLWDITSVQDLEVTKRQLCQSLQDQNVCVWNSTDKVCSVDKREDVADKFDAIGFKYACQTMELSFASQSSLVVIDYILMGISDAIFQVYVLWLIGAMAGGELSLAARYSAAYKGIQSAGAAVAWLTDLIDGFTYKIQAYVCVAFAIFAMIGVVFTIPMFTKNMSDRAHKKDADQKIVDDAKAEQKSSSSDDANEKVLKESRSSSSSESV